MILTPLVHVPVLSEVVRQLRVGLIVVVEDTPFPHSSGTIDRVEGKTDPFHHFYLYSTQKDEVYGLSGPFVFVRFSSR